jgi:hypothetical protein
MSSNPFPFIVRLDQSTKLLVALATLFEKKEVELSPEQRDVIHQGLLEQVQLNVNTLTKRREA